MKKTYAIEFRSRSIGKQEKLLAFLDANEHKKLVVSLNKIKDDVDVPQFRISEIEVVPDYETVRDEIADLLAIEELP